MPLAVEVTNLTTPTGSPHTWEFLLALIPVVVGLLYFAQARWTRRATSPDGRRVRDDLNIVSVAADEVPATNVANAVVAIDGHRAVLLVGEDKEKPKPDDSDSVPVNRKEIVEMERAAADLSCVGTLLLAEAVLIMFIVLHHFSEITDHYAEILEISGYDVMALALLVIRTAAYGTVVLTALVVLVRFAGACFDQATRFRKRTHSAHVLNFVLAEYEKNIKSEKVTLPNALEVFKAWNRNVESAFSSVRLIKQKQESVNGSVSPGGGATFNYGAPVGKALDSALRDTDPDDRP
jgi:hypothetical protein